MIQASSTTSSDSKASIVGSNTEITFTDTQRSSDTSLHSFKIKGKNSSKEFLSLGHSKQTFARLSLDEIRRRCQVAFEGRGGVTSIECHGLGKAN